MKIPEGKPPDPATVARLAIPPGKKTARTALWKIAFLVVIVTALALVLLQFNQPSTPSRQARAQSAPLNAGTPAASSGDARADAASKAITFTAIGYVVPRQRIELGPKFPGTVSWIGVEKGDFVKKGQILVRLEDDEYRARALEAGGRVALAQAQLANAERTFNRQKQLNQTQVGTDQEFDDAQRALDVARAELAIAQGQAALAETWLRWCAIEAPGDGVVLDKFVEAHELVLPQSFGKPGNPSTTLLALADLNDLQVELDISEPDLHRIALEQPCRIRPEAFPDRIYHGLVVEIAPEANRQKGTVQVKVWIKEPDRHLIPDFNARVDFLGKEEAMANR
jgi:HlyD family secretion protein